MQDQPNPTTAAPRFTREDLHNLVLYSGGAIHQEDRRVICQWNQDRDARRQGAPIRDYYPGITDHSNERDYQAIIYRELRRLFRWHPYMEVKNSSKKIHDLAFCQDDTEEQVAVAEIKLLRDIEYELFEPLVYAHAVYKDILKLGDLPIPSIMLVLLMNRSKNEANPLEKLAAGLRQYTLLPDYVTDLGLWETFRFEISEWPSHENCKQEFAIAGFFVTPPKE
jgi:hypothetical protein